MGQGGDMAEGRFLRGVLPPAYRWRTEGTRLIKESLLAYKQQVGCKNVAEKLMQQICPPGIRIKSFESRPAYTKTGYPVWDNLFLVRQKGLEPPTY